MTKTVKVPELVALLVPRVVPKVVQDVGHRAVPSPLMTHATAAWTSPPTQSVLLMATRTSQNALQFTVGDTMLTTSLLDPALTMYVSILSVTHVL